MAEHLRSRPTTDRNITSSVGRGRQSKQHLPRLEKAGVETKPLRVSYAAHSSLIDPVLPAFEKVLETVEFKPARVALDFERYGLAWTEWRWAIPKYWLTQMRAPVQFAKSISTLVEQGVTHFVEIGPHPVLLGMGAECVPGATVEWLPSLRRNRTDWSDLLESLQRLYVGGADVDWLGFDRDYSPPAGGAANLSVSSPASLGRRDRKAGRDRFDQTTQMAADDHGDRARGGKGAGRRRPVKLSRPNGRCLERLTNAYSSAVLRKAGIFTRPGDRLTVQEVCNRLGAAEKYQHLLLRWLRRLAGEGQLRVDGEAFVADQPLAVTRPGCAMV